MPHALAAIDVTEGSSPRDIPVQQPARYQVHPNLKTAKALPPRIPLTFIAVPTTWAHALKLLYMLKRQALKGFGCKTIFEDRASGKSFTGRPELSRALEELRPGDRLVLAAWDRATRSMWDGLHIVKHVIDAGATIKVLDFPSLDLATTEGRGFLAMFSAMVERERMRIIDRTREGRRFAMTNGVKMGPPLKLTEHQRNLAAKRMAAGESTRQIARDFNVSHNTIARLR